MSTLRFAAVNADSLLADLDLPPASYRALLKLRALSEAGGRITIDQATIGQLLGLSRPSVNAALRSLELAKLVTKVRNGVYQINPMLAGYNSPEDAVAAVRDMPKDDRLDVPGFVDNYHRAVAAYQDQLAQQRKKRAAQAAAKKAAAAKRRGSLHAVG
ncbi:helix-turn-helix transcriptional regulator [Streptantibioticus ferralitis]|uniref:Helix-turn-helix domain-containing protein n=1 Tax=Streptantibioticus ferralitis TaxID=236510 RepID=A0ABT5Z7J0_9ACTN|nr:helix-turn-helix domain-containing protein [Streptantibioticus ferralitis]MDF2259774.1 helix-turn-helix domain-containing protein [Streptantibioticus ferralitis]